MVRAVLLILLLFGSSVAKKGMSPSVDSLADSLERRSYSGDWQLYPLTLFPYLKAQTQPWQEQGFVRYCDISGYGNIAALQENGSYFIGSRCETKKDGIILYRAERYWYVYYDWIYIEEYVMVTDSFNVLKNYFHRESNHGGFEQIELRIK